MNWNIGDRAMIVQSKDPARLGFKVTVMSDVMTHCPTSGMRWEHPCHFVDYPSEYFSGEFATYRPRHLRPIPDDHSRFHADLISCDDDWTIPWSVTV